MKHVMIDIETLDTRVSAVVASIGAVVFDPYAKVPSPLETFFVKLDTQSQIDRCDRTVAVSTMNWWAEQEAEVRKNNVVPAEKDKQLYDGLLRLSLWSEENKLGNSCWWSHATFDLPILNHAYDQYTIKLPWYFRNARDIRTLVWMHKQQGCGNTNPAPREDHHDALSDAVYQSEYVSAMLRAMHPDKVKV